MPPKASRAPDRARVSDSPIIDIMHIRVQMEVPNDKLAIPGASRLQGIIRVNKSGTCLVVIVLQVTLANSGDIHRLELARNADDQIAFLEISDGRQLLTSLEFAHA